MEQPLGRSPIESPESLYAPAVQINSMQPNLPKIKSKQMLSRNHANNKKATVSYEAQ